MLGDAAAAIIAWLPCGFR